MGLVFSIRPIRRDIPALYLPNADTWVVEANNHVVGFMALLGNEVGAIFIQPEFQGKKIGKMMMDKTKDLHGDLELEVFEKIQLVVIFIPNMVLNILKKKFMSQLENKCYA